LPLKLRGLSLDEYFDNPYSRADQLNDLELRSLVEQVQQTVTQGRFEKIRNGFELRRNMEALIGNLQAAVDQPLPQVPFSESDGVTDVNPETGTLRYPEDNRFSSRIQAAVTLAIQNPDTKFISLGGGLSGWDDHDAAMDAYVPRMQDLINVHGDFGRNANLNNSAGWDHGNNQNLYTIGGNSIRVPGALGKIVGQTEVTGSAARNRLFTQPVEGSYEAEPMSIAASTYQYFGVRNPRALTHDGEYNPDGDDAIDESVAGVPIA